MDKIKCVKISIPSLGKYGWVVEADRLGDLRDDIENSEAGDEYKMQVLEMTQDELNDLPDFVGF